MKQDTKKSIQVYLEEKQLVLLRYLAEKRAIPIASLIQDSVDLYLQQIPIEEDPLMSIIGIGSSEEGDISINHDKYLYEDFEREHNNFRM